MKVGTHPAAQYTVGTIVLSGVNVTTALSATANDGGCGGKIMTVTLYTGAAGSATAAIIGNGSARSVSFTVPTTDGTNAFTVTNSGSNGITAFCHNFFKHWNTHPYFASWFSHCSRHNTCFD